MEQKCELCGKKARMHCESDQANLCWECDEKVHSANFLVAKHTRCLLCHICQSPTPWAASGQKLGPTVSVCDGCFDRHSKSSEMDHQGETRGFDRPYEADGYSVNEDGGDSDDDDEDSYDSEEESEEEEEEEVDGENQVVPWSCDSPPPVPSSSGSGEESSENCAGGRNLRTKRIWDEAFIDSDDETGCASSQGNPSLRAAANEEVDSPASFRPLKQQRSTVEGKDSVAELKSSVAIVSSLARIQKSPISDGTAAAAVLGICRLCKY